MTSIKIIEYIKKSNEYSKEPKNLYEYIKTHINLVDIDACDFTNIKKLLISDFDINNFDDIQDQVIMYCIELIINNQKFIDLVEHIIRGHNTDVFRVLYLLKPEIINLYTEYNNSMLYLATIFKAFDIIDFMIEKKVSECRCGYIVGFDEIYYTDTMEQAIKKDHVGLIKYLVENHESKYSILHTIQLIEMYGYDSPKAGKYRKELKQQYDNNRLILLKTIKEEEQKEKQLREKQLQDKLLQDTLEFERKEKQRQDEYNYELKKKEELRQKQLENERLMAIADSFGLFKKSIMKKKYVVTEFIYQEAKPEQKTKYNKFIATLPIEESDEIFKLIHFQQEGK